MLTELFNAKQFASIREFYMLLVVWLNAYYDLIQLNRYDSTQRVQNGNLLHDDWAYL